MKQIDQLEAYEAIGRLLVVASQDTGQARRVADFLLAWHNAGENGGWDPVDLWSVDTDIADDMLLVLGLIRESRRIQETLDSAKKSTLCGKAGEAKVSFSE